MKSKINFKKLLSLLLLSANFTFLPTIINSQSFNNLVYAESNFDSNQGIEVTTDYYNTPLIHIPDTQFYVEKKLFDNEPERYSKDNLNKIYNEAKEKASNKIGLTFSDNIKISIYIYDDNNEALGESLNSIFFDFSKRIEIKNSYFFNSEEPSFSNEIMKALLFFNPDKNNEIIIDYHNTPLIHIPETQFYVEKKLFDKEPELYSKDNLIKKFNEAKEQARNKIGFSYSDNIKVPIYVYDDEHNDVFGQFLNSFFIHTNEYAYIKIKRSPFFDQEQSSLTNVIMEASVHFNPDSEIIIDYHNVPLVHIPDTSFYVEKKLFDNKPERYSKDNLNKRFNEVKEKIYDKIGLHYNDDIKIPIYIYDDNNDVLGEYTNADFTPINEFGEIRIKNSRFFNSEYSSLPHEMIHALLFYSLGEHYNNLNLGVNEGFATQVNDLDSWGELNELPAKNLLFVNSYPPSREDRLKFYHSHQHLILDLINLKGKNIINDFIELVKNGIGSVEALRFLGADEIIEQYNPNTNAQEYYFQTNFNNQLSYA